jgi:hypothetical protein
MILAAYIMVFKFSERKMVMEIFGRICHIMVQVSFKKKMLDDIFGSSFVMSRFHTIG